MRLINVKTLELEYFDDVIPGYAILSHRWGPEEVIYDDMRAGPSRSARQKQGFAKIQGVCARALESGCEYVWVDTCCIDKSSSAELSEAINSMFVWYQEAELCFALLDDFTANGNMPLSKSLWFTRGWTLQELIAPDEVILYDRDWKRIGDRSGMSRELALVTGIPAALLGRVYSLAGVEAWLKEYSVAAKMSWASNRHTTRIEDTAYCLMDLFGVHLPLIYGEGSKAFRRLQEAIVRETKDMSILIHNSSKSLADDPRSFRHSGHVGLGPEDDSMERLGVVIVNQGLELTTLACPARLSSKKSFGTSDQVQTVCSLALLNCSLAGDHLSRLAVLYRHAGNDPDVNRVSRAHLHPVFCIPPSNETGERVHDGQSSELRYDLSKCRYQRLYIGPDKSVSTYWDLPTLQPPLRVIHTGADMSQTKHNIMGSGDGPISPLNCNVHRWFRLTDSVDEFFILWGFVLPPVGRHGYRAGWWRNAVPRCYIVERTGSLKQVSPPEDQTKQVVWDESWTNAGDLFKAATRSITSRRPTGLEIHVTSAAVDFLGRRSFELRIEERMPASASAPENETSGTAQKQHSMPENMPDRATLPLGDSHIVDWRTD